MKLEPGKVIVISGPMTCGKSCLLMQIANANAAAGRRVLVADLQIGKSFGRFKDDRRFRHNDVEIVRNPKMQPAELMSLVEQRQPDLLCVDGAEFDCGEVLGSLATSAKLPIIATVALIDGWPTRYAALKDAHAELEMIEVSMDVVDMEYRQAGEVQRMPRMRLDVERARFVEVQ